jgi:hypothetical protein
MDRELRGDVYSISHSRTRRNLDRNCEQELSTSMCIKSIVKDEWTYVRLMIAYDVPEVTFSIYIGTRTDALDRRRNCKDGRFREISREEENFGGNKNLPSSGSIFCLIALI